MLQSLTQVYRALSFGTAEALQIDNLEGHWVLEGMENLRGSAQVSEELTKFVLEAVDAGVVSHTEAEDLLHPLQGYLKRSILMMSDTHAGIHRDFVKDHSVGRRETDSLKPKMGGEVAGTNGEVDGGRETHVTLEVGQVELDSGTEEADEPVMELVLQSPQSPQSPNSNDDGEWMSARV